METELSVSLVRNHRIIDARTVRRGGTLRVPRSCPAQLELDETDGDELDHVVFDFRELEPVMSLPEGVYGEIASGTEPQAVQAGMIALDRDVRGWLTLGESTILVQRLPPLAPTPRTKLPAVVRSPWARLEKPLAITLAAALAAEVVMVVLVHRQPEPLLDEGPDWPPASAPMSRVIPPPIPQVTPPPTTSKKPAVVKKVAPAASPTERARHPGPPTSTAAQKKIAELMALFGKSPALDPKSSIDLEKAFDHVGEMRPTAEASLAAHRGPTGRYGPVGIGDPWVGVDGPGERPVLVEHPRPHPPVVIIDPQPDPRPTGPDDDYARILKAVRDRARGIQHCYEAGLRTNQQLSGKVLIEMNVVRAGTVSEVEFPEKRLADERVMDCLGRTIRGWRMPVLTAHDELDVEFPFVFTPASGP